MKRWLLLIMLLPVGAARCDDGLKLQLLYMENGNIFDRTCISSMKADIDPAWIEETARRRDEFQAIWNAQGKKYLQTAIDGIGLKFPYGEMQGTLTVCPLVPSLSLPLLINVRPFLSSVAKGAPPRWPSWYFAEVVFHELMHTYVRPINSVSALRQKYRDEDVAVLNHLHVMAIEKYVLVKLNMKSELQFMDNDYRTRSPAPYKRAWEIVNDVEGEQVFIDELKSAAQKPR